ncbi:GH12247 [Drosophila grimshawi]|uniref:GH12247 n=1 Tax=Drosophila grimshawi TaxID=7222 RepID=B4JJJ1_DROGR|nr:GH12247 [Drosophila grimshawi]
MAQQLDVDVYRSKRLAAASLSMSMSELASAILLYTNAGVNQLGNTLECYRVQFGLPLGSNNLSELDYDIP